MILAVLVFVLIIIAVTLILAYVFSKNQPPYDEVMTNLETGKTDKNIFVKKYNKANVNGFNTAFRLFGMILVLLLCIYAWTFKTYDDVLVFNNENMGEVMEEELPPQTLQQPPPPPPQVIEVVEVEDEVEIEEEPPPPEDFDAPPPPPPPPPPKREEPEIVVDWAAVMPEFPGGEAKMQEFIQKNIVYPRMAQEDDIQGLVVLRVTVGKNGRIENIEVQKPLGGGCTQAAIDVVNKMPPWSPGKQLDKPVKVRVSLPIRFTLTE